MRRNFPEITADVEPADKEATIESLYKRLEHPESAIPTLRSNREFFAGVPSRL
jgi:hypothetical protein